MRCIASILGRSRSLHLPHKLHQRLFPRCFRFGLAPLLIGCLHGIGKALAAVGTVGGKCQSKTTADLIALQHSGIGLAACHRRDLFGLFQFFKVGRLHRPRASPRRFLHSGIRLHRSRFRGHRFSFHLVHSSSQGHSSHADKDVSDARLVAAPTRFLSFTTRMQNSDGDIQNFHLPIHYFRGTMRDKK